MKKAIAVLSIALMLLSACGKDVSQQNQNKMTEEEALDTLTKVSQAETAGRSAFGKKPAVSYEGLFKLLQDLIKQGKLKVPNQNGRGALSVNDLSSLVNVFAALSGGGVNSGIMGLVNSMVNTSGSSSQAKFDITMVIQLLNAALPIIATIAPQYAGLVQALVVILPIVQTFITMFLKPTSMNFDYQWAFCKA